MCKPYDQSWILANGLLSVAQKADQTGAKDVEISQCSVWVSGDASLSTRLLVVGLTMNQKELLKRENSLGNMLTFRMKVEHIFRIISKLLVYLKAEEVMDTLRDI